MRSFDVISTDSDDLNRIQDRVAKALTPVFASRVVDGRLAEAVAVGTSETLVAHKLNRLGVKWMLVAPGADARVWQTRAPDAQFLYLQASAAVTTDLWVF